MKKHQNHRYFTAVCIASAIFAVLLCLALFLIVTGDRSELERVEAQAAVDVYKRQLDGIASRNGICGQLDRRRFEKAESGIFFQKSGICKEE